MFSNKEQCPLITWEILTVAHVGIFLGMVSFGYQKYCRSKGAQENIMIFITCHVRISGPGSVLLFRIQG